MLVTNARKLCCTHVSILVNDSLKRRDHPKGTTSFSVSSCVSCIVIAIDCQRIGSVTW